MRGVKSGLEARVREIAPHLMDIDGDACHHMHNIVKNFTKHFNSTLEKLLDRFIGTSNYLHILLIILKKFVSIWA